MSMLYTKPTWKCVFLVLSTRGPARRLLRRARACARRRPLSPVTPLHELCFVLRNSCFSSRISLRVHI